MREYDEFPEAAEDVVPETDVPDVVDAPARQEGGGEATAESSQEMTAGAEVGGRDADTGGHDDGLGELQHDTGAERRAGSSTDVSAPLTAESTDRPAVDEPDEDDGLAELQSLSDRPEPTLHGETRAAEPREAADRPAEERERADDGLAELQARVDEDRRSGERVGTDKQASEADTPAGVEPPTDTRASAGEENIDPADGAGADRRAGAADREDRVRPRETDTRLANTRTDGHANIDPAGRDPREPTDTGEVLGGRFKDIKPEAGYERHHMPARSVTDLPRGDGPSIKMEAKDHEDTGSFGRRRSADEYRREQRALIEAGSFKGAIDMDIEDVRSKFGDKYDRHIDQMLATLPDDPDELARWRSR